MKYPEYKLSLLISNNKSSAKNIETLGFKPDVYSPNFKLISKKEIDELHSKSIKVIPWTVNESKQMKKLMELGVDGFITEHSFIKFLRSRYPSGDFILDASGKK